MKNIVNQISQRFDALYDKSTDKLEHWFLKQHHKFTITGLSRSGKSMLFTSLMTILKYRSEQKYQCLPLLTRLPMEQVDAMWVEDAEGQVMFPLDDHLQSLEKGQWPAPTEQVYAFKLVVRLKQTHGLKKHLLPYTDIVFEFLDYPGEWITDLPMLNTRFGQWSDSSWAQQLSEPQSAFAHTWHEKVKHFDFDQAPTDAAIKELVEAYRGYLAAAKAGGISMLQPGSFLIDEHGFNWRQNGFTPLPSKIAHDHSHPWCQVFTQHFTVFQTEWLTPLRADAFVKADKQIILVDMFEGLNHSKQHLYQLKETLSHLAETFVYGNTNWFEKRVLRKHKIGRVAFVATKMDLIPEGFKPDMLRLLEEVTAGARAKFDSQAIEFEHFLVSAIQATDEGEQSNALRYTNNTGNYVEAQFEPLPESIKAMAADEHYPLIKPALPSDYLPRILNGRGLDRLFQFLLDE